MKNDKKNETKFNKKRSLIVTLKEADLFNITELRDFQTLIFKIVGFVFILATVTYISRNMILY
jgi:hypothetical protein